MGKSREVWEVMGKSQEITGSYGKIAGNYRKLWENCGIRYRKFREITEKLKRILCVILESYRS